MFKEIVTDLVSAALEERPDLFLIDLHIGEANQIKIVIDGDQGVRVEDCISMSRAVEHNLDREETDFSLEVTSAGATAPLELPRQYVKNIGRKLAIKTAEGEKLEGDLTAADDSGCTLSWKTREPKPVGKGKVTVQKEATLAYADIAEAKVMIKF
ncbi:ribosome assembly cofactor RimP [Gilvibacter sp.]|uniref:ribosome assembly cofactor RimP n=1 Tax=Gilvibacter sp. TaxID=2729997 RepID=UPI0025B8B258|nr:ribosome assembly cofactor RimP [Gilvibacter sp.]NQX76645.1 ribosome assembly cofactor RimP [Gilvibacter sp.]